MFDKKELLRTAREEFGCGSSSETRRGRRQQRYECSERH